MRQVYGDRLQPDKKRTPAGWILDPLYFKADFANTDSTCRRLFLFKVMLLMYAAAPYKLRTYYIFVQSLQYTSTSREEESPSPFFSRSTLPCGTATKESKSRLESGEDAPFETAYQLLCT